MTNGVSTRGNSTLMMWYSGFGDCSTPWSKEEAPEGAASCCEPSGCCAASLADERLRRVAPFGWAERSTGPIGPKPMPGYAPLPENSPVSICGPCGAVSFSTGIRSADPYSWKRASAARPHPGQQSTATRSTGMIIAARPMSPASASRRIDDDDDGAPVVDACPRRRPRSSVAGESLLPLAVPSEGNHLECTTSTRSRVIRYNFPRDWLP